MANNKCILLIFCCCIAVALGNRVPDSGHPSYLEHPRELKLESPVLHRQARSPDGSLDLTYTDGDRGREASARYNQNLYRSDDGRVNVDAYANANRNFDNNRNDYGGGVRGTIRF